MKETEEVERAKAAAGAKLSAPFDRGAGDQGGAPPALSYIEISPPSFPFSAWSAALYSVESSALAPAIRAGGRRCSCR